MDLQSTTWTPQVLLFALVLQPSTLGQQYEGCSSQFQSFENPIGEHEHLNEGQYVVPWLNFSCSGTITAWEFSASVQDDRIPDKQVILQLWHPLPNNINPTSPSQFTFVTEVVLSTSVEGRFNRERPFSFDLSQPLPFHSGDVFGFSVLNTVTGVRFAAVTASGIAEGGIYSRRTGGAIRGDDDDDEAEDRRENNVEVTLFDVNSGVDTLLSYSPAMTVRCSTDMDSGLTTPASSLPPVSLRTVGQTTTTDGSTLADQPSVVAVLPPTKQPPSADQGSPNLIIIGVVVVLAVVVAACVVIVTVAALCSIKRPCVKGVPLEEGGSAEKALAGLPYVQFSEAASDKHRHPQVPTVGKYEAVVGHKEVSKYGVTQQLQLLNSQSSVTSQYAPTYDYAQGNDEYASVGYYYVPPAAAREGELQSWCKTATLVDVASMNKDGAFPKYENIPYAPPPPVLDELYNQLSSGMCLEIPRATVRKNTLLGYGQFGEVYKGIWETPWDGPQEVAIKMLKEASSDIERVKFLQEAAIMTQFRHPHIVRLLGSVTVDEPSMLLLEYLHGGDLRGHLQGCIPYNDIQPIELLRFCREIADGMKYLSNKGFVHRDLAARNILLDKNLKCKVADFGLSKDLQEGTYYVSSGGKIPVKWTAPEALFYKKYSTSSDVWSYGMLMYEIWSLGHKPFSHMGQAKVVEVFQNDVGYIQPPPPGCPREMFKLMVLCWAYDHHSRPTFSQIVNQLADTDSVLLSIPPQCLQNVSHPKEAQCLGEALEMAHDMYLDLQHYYK